MYGQPADVTTGKKDRSHDERIGRERQSGTAAVHSAHTDRGLIFQRGENLVSQMR